MPGFFAGSALQRAEGEHVRGLPKCGLCRFATGGCETPRMPPGGTGANGVMIVAEHPSEADDRRGRHFVGSQSAILREAVEDLGEDLGECRLTYAMICRPPKGRPWEDKNVAACRPALLQAIHDAKPKVVVLLGPAAARSLIPTERGGSVGTHERWVGMAIPSATHGAWLCPTWSPAQLARFGDEPLMLRFWREHLRRAFALRAKPPAGMTMPELWGQCEPILSAAEGRRRLRALAEKSGLLAYDYETNCLKPDSARAELWAASFCLEGEPAFAVMLRGEPRTRALLRPILRSPRLRLCGCNIKFESRWTRTKLGYWPRREEFDTLLGAHYLDNRGKISSIKFQAFVRLGVPDYDRYVEQFLEPGEDGFNRIHELDPKDLLSYNAADSLLEVRVARQMMGELGIK